MLLTLLLIQSIQVMGLFDVDYDTWIWRNLPISLRKGQHFAWLKATVAPVKYLNMLFRGFRVANLYKLRHNGQVFSMEQVLNDVFDFDLRRIRIVDGVYYDPAYTFTDAEAQPVFIDLDSEISSGVIDDPDPVPLYTESETFGSGYQFIVRVPSDVTATANYSLNRMKSEINKYRLASKSNYNIEFI